MEDIALHASIDDIIKELDSKNLLHMTSGKIKELKNNIFQKMYFSREELLYYHKVLKDYIYVDEIDEIKLGSFIRWFNLKNMDITKLTNGGIVIDLIQNKEDEIMILCKNFKNKYFTINMNNSIIFKKMNTQEKILIKIVDYIHK